VTGEKRIFGAPPMRRVGPPQKRRLVSVRRCVSGSGNGAMETDGKHRSSERHGASRRFLIDRIGGNTGG
jgi:hypothetical protein